jgi:hypothetical protein
MKRSIIVALLLSSWAWGQNLKATSHTLTTAIDYCANEISFGTHTKKMSDMFPDECGVPHTPIDVPAIERPVLFVDDWHNCPPDYGVGVSTSSQASERYSCIPPRGWTCADRRRILLTSEDGRKHCVTFENPSNR